MEVLRYFVPVHDPAFWGLGVSVLCCMLLVWWLARRLADRRVAPRLGQGASFGAQLFANVGTEIEVRDTIGLRRIHASIGVRLVALFATGMIGWTILQMYGPEVLSDPATHGWPIFEYLMLAAALWSLAYHLTWRMAYDPEELTVEAFGFRLARQPWRKLIVVTDRDGWFLKLHFADGTSVRVPKHIVGRTHLLQTVDRWINDTCEYARTARG